MRGPEQAHPAADAVLRSPLSELVDEAGLEVEGAEAGAQPGQVRGQGECVDEHVVPLARRDRTDAQQLATGGGARGQVARVAARRRDVHPVVGQSVVVEDPRLRPVARDHDVRDRGEHRAFARSALERGLSQRHVQQDDQPQALRLGDGDLGCGRGDQPVEQHECAVGDPGQDVGQGDPVGHRRPRPVAGDGVLAHVPARSRPGRRRPCGRRGCRHSAWWRRRCRPEG